MSQPVTTTAHSSSFSVHKKRLNIRKRLRRLDGIISKAVETYNTNNTNNSNNSNNTNTNNKEGGGEEEAYFALGWFWTPAETFSSVKGVKNVTVGYLGARKENNRKATYKTCCEGDGNAEALKIEFNRNEVSYDELLEIFFDSHDASRITSTQYESALWPTNDEQYEKAKEFIYARNESARARAITTKIRNLNDTTFYRAERYHQDYNKKNAMRLVAAIGVFLLNMKAPNSFMLQEQMKIVLGSFVIVTSLEQMLPFYDKIFDELEGARKNGNASNDSSM